MTRFQSLIGILTVLACLTVGMWASQKAPSPDLIAAIAPPTRLVSLDAPAIKASSDSDEALIQSIIDEETQGQPEVTPRKLTVDREKPAADHPVWRLIVRELPDATDEERQIWFEQLRSLPLNAVEDLLRVRRNATPLMDLPEAIAPQKIATKISDRPLLQAALSDGTRSALEQYRAVLLQNLLNADTVGYRCVEPRLSPFPMTEQREDAPPLEGLRWIGRCLKLKQGEFETTDRPLDLAISGVGWFVVMDEAGKLAFTRNGAMEMNEQRTLEIMTAAGPCTVHPPITLPEKLTQIFVDTKGTIYSRLDGKSFDESPVIGHIQLARFFDDSALQLSEDGLYRPLPKAGEMVRRTPGDQCGSLQQGMLERSNVNVEQQQEALKRIEKWLELRDSFTGEMRP